MIKFLLFLPLVLLLNFPAFANASCIELCNNLSTFEQWQKYIDKKGTLAEVVLDIHDIREKRDLPNSMARLPSISDPVKNLYLKIESLKKLDRCEVRKILSCIFLQNYDESISRTAIEIALRLSDKDLTKWASKLPKEEKINRLNLIEEIKEYIHINPSQTPYKKPK